MQKLPLHDEHQKRGARFVTRSGWEIPDHYGDLPSEYHAVRHEVGLIDSSFRGKLKLRGKDRVEFLHGMVTNDIKSHKPGGGCYAAITNAKAKMLSDCRIYCLADSLLLDLEPEVVQKIKQHLDRYIIASDVVLEDLTEKWGLLSLYGPEASNHLIKTLGLAGLPKTEYACLETSVQSRNMIIARNEITGEVGYDLYISTEDLPFFFQKMLAVGARPVGQEALNILRIEAGIPRYDVDMDESHFPMEAGLKERAISYTKGCYIGQETIARTDAMGHMNRFLMGLEVKGEAVPQKSQTILSGERAIGTITSGVRSPTLSKIIALGYVHSDFAKPGTEVSIVVGTEHKPATVVALPFYKRTSKDNP
ncbi:MAG TPA: aminomethyltransferase family protein [Nitrospiria bacterium]|nr:aminomethyltransferase family protein [Nitrospiria bacterium]